MRFARKSNSWNTKSKDPQANILKSALCIVTVQ